MQNTHSPRTRNAILSIVAAGIVTAAITFPLVTAGATQPVTVVGGTDAERQLVDWAVERFEMAELPLPQVTLTFHDTDDGCRGYQGFFSRSNGTVDICNRGEGKTDQRHTILHELAHAWSLNHMTETEMDGFADHRGLDHWHSSDVAWWQMGKEHAAEIVAWGLQDADEYKSIWLFQEECGELADAFEMLTGTTPLHTNTEYCA